MSPSISSPGVRGSGVKSHDRAGRRATPTAIPKAVMVPAVLGLLFFAIPLIGLAARTPWADLPGLLTSPVVVDALRLSMISSLAATALAAIMGVPLAWFLARVHVPGKSIIRALVTLPLVLPPVVGGAALLFALGRRGVLGGPIESATGFLLPFSIWGVIVANTFVAMPFLVITVEGALHSSGTRHEAAAATLGAGPLTIFRRITLPMIRPSIGAGLVLTWARALGEFGATVTFAGNAPGSTRTLPLAVFVTLGQDRETAIAISMILVVVSLVVLIALRDRWWRNL